MSSSTLRPELNNTTQLLQVASDLALTTSAQYEQLATVASRNKQNRQRSNMQQSFQRVDAHDTRFMAS
jgi:hypothetical protein